MEEVKKIVLKFALLEYNLHRVTFIHLKRTVNELVLSVAYSHITTTIIKRENFSVFLESFFLVSCSQSPPPHSRAQAGTDPLCATTVLPLLEICRSENIQHVVFISGIFIMFLKSISIVTCISSPFFFFSPRSSLFMVIPQIVYLLTCWTDTGMVFSF